MTKEEIIQGTGLSREDLDVLVLLESVIQADTQGQGVELAATEENNIIAFLEKAIGNMQLNKQLLELGKLAQHDTGIGFSVINMMRNVTFKSRHWHEIHADDRHQLTLSQLGALSDLASLTRDLVAFERAGLIRENSSLAELYHDAQQALKEGFSKDLDVSSKAMDFEIKATQGAPMFHHTNYQKDEFVLSEFLYSEEYKIKLDKLIEHDETKEFLKKHLGDDWLQQLEHKFGVIQREIHDAQLIGPIYHGMSHQDATAQEQFQAEDKSPATLICSPFVGISTMAAIQELNIQVTQELKNKGVQEIPSPLLQLPVNEKLDALSPAHFINALDKCRALERLPGQATIMMKERLSGAKSEGEEVHQTNRPK
ncbi:hypothetical protein OQJ19_07035 [Fluoribacter gormanii]|uniref:Uncharacterized protein n=1 Tax=Fluoribacter gormanii TaxID=464 RepID=A0A377GEJ1_9GAMM|nr:hypothetical protein [Fluoribacter gormanii]KTD00469.1 hypothetical protein Lgor_2945 [Fluoribacter gormanii]MCW8470409.1 hypothetical protein [Fluoribacter gormanii]SIR09836.1 hypothetical protein SAMN05421777_106114 [Fluoribacter gormanii]STO23229.1 Uncharacterised protein [Fluoribacter gormanii]